MSTWNWPGARWWKFDFHTHTPASADTVWHQNKDADNALTCEQWLLWYMAAEIDCVAITDHNSGEWVDGLKAAYKRMNEANPKPEGFRALTLFPGVEISVTGGLHVLAIFDPSTTGSTITSLLGGIDFPAQHHGKTDAVDVAACSGNSLKDVIKKIHDAGGLVIPAHVDKAKGLLILANMDALKHALDLGVDAIELTDPQFAKPELYLSKNPGWAEVVGSDCHSFQGQAVPGSRYTWIKMSAPTINGLRLALLDGNGVSVRRYDFPGTFLPDEVSSPVIVSLSVNNMQVMGNGQPIGLLFNPFFNAIIGGRGTGKSTLVHAMRLVFGREGELSRLSETSNARQTFKRFAMVPRSKQDRDSGGLREQSEIRVEFLREGIRYRLFWTKEGAKVTEWDGQAWNPSASQTIDQLRFPIRLFSQGQIADLAGDNQQALLDIIDAAAGVGPAKEAWEEAKRSYQAQQAKIREVNGRLTKRESVQIQLDDIVRKLAKLEGSDHAAILKRYQISRQQSNEITHTFNAADELKLQVVSLAPRLILDDLRSAVFDPQADADVLNTVTELRQAVTDAQTAVNTIAQELNRHIDTLRNNPAMGAWSQRIAAASQAYEKLQTELTKEGITDLSVYGQLVQQRQALQSQLQQLETLAAEKNLLQSKAVEQLQRVDDARVAITRGRATFLVQQLANNPYVSINVVAGGEDIASAERRVRELIDVLDARFEGDIYQAGSGTTPATGLVAEWGRATDRLAAGGVLRESLARAAGGERILGGPLCNNLTTRATKDPAFIDRIRCLSFEDGLEVKVSRKGDGRDFQPIQQASAGQRSAAMLAFLLSYGTEPIVLDQPEDDLDNHMIYELIVQQIRENKQRRQLIVVTHNPNIVVNGDAEMIYALDFRRGQCLVTEKGALQDEPVREEVCRIMEGGQEAFRRRWQRLGKAR